VVRKPFEQDLFDEFDAPAKQAIAKHIESVFDVVVMPNPDQYGIDLLIIKNDKVLGSAEVEVRQWIECRFSTIHVLQRKQKYFNDRTLFFALAKDLKSAHWIETNKIDRHPLIEVSNYKVASGELFFDVPINEFVRIELETNA
jgi:hypothetical protein